MVFPVGEPGRMACLRAFTGIHINESHALSRLACITHGGVERFVIALKMRGYFQSNDSR